MPTLNIQGQKVNVDDSFLHLSPDEQSKTVDEIASHLGVQPAASSAPQTPYERATAGMGYGPAAARPSPVRTPDQEQALSNQVGVQSSMSGANGAVGASLTGAVQGMPIVGPALLGLEKRAAAGLATLGNGQSYDQNLQRAQDITGAAQSAHPNYTTGGEVAGAVVPLLALGSTELGARALGIEGPSLGGRILASGVSNAAIGSADTAARGGSAGETLNSGLISGGLGLGIPAVGAGVKAGLGALIDRFAPSVNALVNPTAEAQRRVGTALARDTTANPAGILSPADEAVAANANIPIVNADRGGEVTRALVRSVANQSPEARAAITNTADDRFASQGTRAVGFIRKLFGGNVDDLAFHDSIRSAADAANGPAYAAANAHPNAQSLYTPGLQDLMQSPSMRAAVDAVPTRSADRGAVQGFKEIPNPFTQNSQGAYVLKQKADGTLVSPNLQFWNQAKINLDSQIGAAQRAGDRGLTSDLMGLKTKLLGELDTAVPQYKAARQGAAGFFGAEDALEAGKNFANTPRAIPEATRAHAQFTPAQRQAFAVGYASELMDKLKVPSDRTNVINSVFGNQAARESTQLALGPAKAAQIEAYARVEGLADKLRGSLGNSTTARQLVELGIGAGVGGGAGYGLTGDWKGAALGAVAPKTLKYLGTKADTQVYEKMAALLTQNSPSALQIAKQLAAKDPAYMKALTNIGISLAAPARGASLFGQQQNQ